MITVESWYRLDWGLRVSAPFTLALFFVLIGMAPWHIADYSTIAPCIGLMAAFYWGIYRPDIFGVFSSASLGLVQDMLAGTPLGLNVFVFIVIHRLAEQQRQLFLAHGFYVLWWGYALCAMLSGLLLWFCCSLWYFTFIPLSPILVHEAAGMALFPIISAIFGMVQRALPIETRVL